MELSDFAAYVQQMRQDQIAYFTAQGAGKGAALAAAKASERMIDRMLLRLCPAPCAEAVAQEQVILGMEPAVFAKHLDDAMPLPVGKPSTVAARV